MKKLLSICVFTLLTTLLTAQVSKTVNLTTAGTLSNQISEIEKTVITDLYITGSIDARDVKFMRDELLNLSILDLSGTTIQTYNGVNGTLSNTTVYLDNEIPASAFAGKISLTNINLPNNLTSISHNAFESCSGLKGNFIIPSTVTTIGDKAFFYCSNISGTLILPNTITNIGRLAFAYCEKISEFRVQYTYGTNYYSNNGVLFKWGNGFTNLVCYPIASTNTSYTIPNGTTTISISAFGLCGKLNNISIPNSVMHIERAAFNNCSGLTEITLPNSIEVIDSSTFSLCTQLKQIKIPNSVSIIKENAFWMCYALSNLTLGSSLQSIKDQSFNGCDLKTITISTEIPPTIFNTTFGSTITPTCSLIVPKNSKSLYETADFWKNFLNISENTITEFENLNGNDIKIFNYQNEIIIEGISKGDIVSLYTVNGKQIRTVISKGERFNFQVDRDAVYLIKIGEKTFKVF